MATVSRPDTDPAYPVRVAFGVTTLLGQEQADGIATYTSRLQERLLEEPQLQLTPFSFSPPSTVRNVFGAGAFKRQALAAFCGRPFRALDALRGDIDLIHATDHFVPRSRLLPVVATLMDAIPLSHPEWVSYRLKGLKNAMWRQSFHWATRIITISEFSRREIVKYFGIPDSRIDVVPLGVDEDRFLRPATRALKDTAGTYNLPENFILCVGTLQPRKNIPALIQAHGALPDALRRRYPLIVIGRRGWNCDRELTMIDEADARYVRWLGHVPEEHLKAMLHLASLMVFPSLYEGFGLPMLESFAAGTPVIAGNGAALPEVAGGAALLVDATDPLEIAAATTRLLENPELAREHASMGQKRARHFSWAQTASGTMEAYRKVLSDEAR